jgi:histidyl-tRNA synthetase
MHDLLPADMRAFRRVEDAFRTAAGAWGYQEIRTPTLEHYSLFTSCGALTPDMLARVYSFLDWDGWSGERVVLRPDSTVPVARAAAEAGIAIPARLFYVQNRFRFTDGEDGEDWQCGVEYLGAPASLGEVEVAAIACETLDALDISPEVVLSHAGVARGVIAAINHGDSIVSRDALDAVVEQGLAALRPLVGEYPRVAAFLDVALRPARDLALLQNLVALSAEALPGAAFALNELAGVAGALAGSGRLIAIDLGMPSDFEYYTGTVYEFRSGSQAWGRGGRYSLGGPVGQETACGLGLEATELASHLKPAGAAESVVFVVPANDSAVSRAVEVARTLHRAGIAAVLERTAPPDSLSVRVGQNTLSAHTPEGERAIYRLEDVVGILIKYK